MKAIKVSLWGKEIGRLAWHKERHLTYFTPHPAITQDELTAIAPLANIRCNIPEYGNAEKIFQKLPPFLADSLPDDWGNELFDHWCKEQKIAPASVTPLEKLSFIGKRGMGAFEFEPESSSSKNEKIDIDSLIALAQKIFVEREDAHIAPDESITMQMLYTVGTSAGGRQPKAIIAIHKKSGEIRSGQIIHDNDYDYYILKFGDALRSSAELEMTYYNMCCMAGIQMMESRLYDVDGVKHFLTLRFDRADGNKLHTQTLAALDPEATSYEQLVLVCRKLNLPETAIDEVFRRMVFNILANNTDDHNRNFSFIMNEGREWSLSPAYDMTYIFNKGGYQPESERCLSLAGKIRNITIDDVLSFAKANGIRRAKSIIESVAKSISAFRTLATRNGVREEWIGRIEQCLNKNLEEWGLQAATPSIAYIDSHGRHILNVRIEQAFKGNFHLLATIDSRPCKYIIRVGTPLHSEITRIGVTNITKEQLSAWVEEHLRHEVQRIMEQE